MSKLKRMRKKRAAQKKANIRLMSLHGELRETKATGSLLRRMTRDHVDVLQNIEFALISGYREDRGIDDRIIAEALRAAIRDETPESDRAKSLLYELEQVYGLRCDVSDDVWKDGLRTVLQSVRRHSSLRPGERNYLDFVSDFIV
ncbi:MAG: hypothetical protein A2Z25_09335 [Planctomycetes bacterium RBG_16_55_9]|nr:MAG: hypothetical protein A2Z25_09335 [Planctomycetes bacterium RBG_16_55_9]